MTEPESDRDVHAALDGIDGPRPLPSDLDADLAGLLAGDDPVRLLGAGSVPLPADLRDRLAAGITTELPADVRRRLVRVLRPATGGPTVRVLQVAAVVVAVLLVAGGFAFADRVRDGGGPGVDVAAEAPQGAGVDRLPGIGEEPDDPAVTASAAEVPTTAAPVAPTTAPPRRRPAKNVSPPTGEGHLIAYSSCDDFLDRTKTAALAAVGPYGLEGPRSDPTVQAGRPRPASSSAATTSGSSTADDAGGGPFVDASTTNNQEAGVDEPDIVKSDGRRIVALTDLTLRIIRDDGANLRVVGSLHAPDDVYWSSLLVAGDRAVVLGSTYRSYGAPKPTPAAERQYTDAPVYASRYLATISTVDLHDPSAPTIISTVELDGAVATARLVAGKIRIVVTSTSLGPQWVTPTDDTDEARQRAIAENQRLVRESTLDDWVPRYTLLQGTDVSTARTGRLCACDDTLRPADVFAGASTLSVLTFDPQRADEPPDGSAAVQGSAEVVYASPANLYVTTHDYAARTRSGSPTAIHRFDISGDGTATYRGSGEVRGFPLNQFSLSERAGHLRVATTYVLPSDDGTSSTRESFVSVLAVRDDRLDPVGQVGSLGKGERIYAVRFLDDVGYVVTFRQTDPLYTVDLSDPTRPRVVGELKIPGFSAYLHPVGDGRLLGIGQDAGANGRAIGAQISSFDVGSLDAPTEVARISFGNNSRSEVQEDHHAFLYWPAARRAVVPVTQSEWQENELRTTSWVSVVAVPDDGRITEAGRLTHDRRPGTEGMGTGGVSPIRRSFVVGGVLYTLSRGGILASDLGSLADRSWLSFVGG